MMDVIAVNDRLRDWLDDKTAEAERMGESFAYMEWSRLSGLHRRLTYQSGQVGDVRPVFASYLAVPSPAPTGRMTPTRRVAAR